MGVGSVRDEVQVGSLRGLFFPVTLSVYLPLDVVRLPLSKSRPTTLRRQPSPLAPRLVLEYLMHGLGAIGKWRLVEQWAAGQRSRSSVLPLRAPTPLPAGYSLSLMVVEYRGGGVVGGGAPGGGRCHRGGDVVRGWPSTRSSGAVLCNGRRSDRLSTTSAGRQLLRPVRGSLWPVTPEIGECTAALPPQLSPARSNVSVVAVAFTFALAGAMLAAVFNRASEIPVLARRDRWCVGDRRRGADDRRRSPSRRPCDPFATSPKEPNALGPATTANACRWFRTMTSARWRRRSTECRPAWPSGNDFRPRSAPMSTRPCGAPT